MIVNRDPYEALAEAAQHAFEGHPESKEEDRDRKAYEAFQRTGFLPFLDRLKGLEAPKPKGRK